VRSRPLIAVGVVFVGTPVVAIALSWFRTEWGIGTLSPWLKLAYFASLMYLFALIIYAVGCPEVIRRYDSVFDRIDREREAYARSNPNQRLEVTLSQLGEDDPDRSKLVELSRRRDESGGAERLQVESEIRDLVDPRWDDTVQRYLSRTYVQADRSRVPVRWACLVTWVIGTLAASVVVVHRVIVVFSS